MMKFFRLTFLFVSALIFNYANGQSPVNYKTPGTYQWTVPPCVTSITVKVWGGGGGGGGAASNQNSSNDEACSEGGGGGGGGFAGRTYAVTPGEVYTIVVGAGGAGGLGGSTSATANDGKVGGNSTFNGPATIPFGILTGFGGGFGGGAWSKNTSNGMTSHIGFDGAGGAGGSGANGTSSFLGGLGSAGRNSGSCYDVSGAGGGGAGSGGNGGDATAPNSCTLRLGGVGGSPDGGVGANGQKLVSYAASREFTAGNAGLAIGGGGGGAMIHLHSWPNTWTTVIGGKGGDGQVTIEYTLNGQGAQQPSTISGTQTICSGATEGYSVINDPTVTYTWTYSGTATITGSGNAISLNNITSGGTLTVTPKNACGDGTPRTLTITIGSVPTKPTIVGNLALCGTSGSYSVTNVPGVTYTWSYSGSGTVTGSGNAITLTNVTSGGTLTVTPSSACGTGTPATITISLATTPLQPSSITGNTTVNCGTNSGSYSVTNVPGVTYTWSYSGTGTITGSGNSINLTNITSGGTLTVTPSNTCGTGTPNTITIALGNPPSQPSAITGDTPIPCGTTTGNYSVTNVAGVTYTWSYSGTGTVTGSGNAISLTGISSGGTLTVTPSNGCGNGTPQTFVIAVNTAPTIVTITTTDATCAGNDGTISINATLGSGTSLTYSIDNGQTFQSSKDFTSINNGSFNVVVKDNNGCTATGTANVQNAAAPTIDQIIKVDATCANSNGEITVTATGGTGTLNYSLDGLTYQGTNSFTAISPATYTVYVKDASDCITTGQIQIQAGNVPTATTTNVAPNCGQTDGSITVNVSGGTAPFTYTLGTSTPQAANTFSSLGAGTYVIAILDDKGCTTSVSVTLTTSQQPTISISGNLLICLGQSTTLTASGGTSYTWSSGENTPMITVSPTTSISYTITGTDANSCTGSATVSVTVLPLPNAAFTPSVTSGDGPLNVVFTNTSTNATAYVWDLGNGETNTSTDISVSTTYINGGEYIVILTASNGVCEDTAMVKIKVTSYPIEIYPPNVFTPNGDGANDGYLIQTKNAKTVFVQIFNRWGNLMVTLETPVETWDGGRAVDGVYFYKYKMTDFNDKVYEGNGFLHLIRGK